MPRVFVSYSHQDVGLVQPVVRLLRATEDIVFQDVDSIAPGRKWRREIEEALSASELFVLFWCHHSSKSTEVRAEYRWVLAVGKDVLPVLLDRTPLPAPLNEFQWVDFRHLADSAHRSSRRWLMLAVVCMLMVGISFATYRLLSPQPAPARGAWYLLILGLALVVAAIGVLVTRRVWKRRRLQTVITPSALPPPAPAPGGTYVNGDRAEKPSLGRQEPLEWQEPPNRDRAAVPQDIQHAMAKQLRAELVRRGMGSA